MEDDDLELLRLAALKSIHSKKTQNKEKVGNAIKVVESINSVPSASSPYFPPANHPQTVSRIQTLVNSNDNSTINDPFLKLRRDVITPWVEPEYGVPYNVPQSRSIMPNVQLSPRSAAFVSQNNDILHRRNLYGSPERDRSRSPITPPGGRYTPGRWSLSPPSYKTVNSRPNNEPRNGSRSPIHREKSPQIFRRSPLPSSKSQPQQTKKSRSPLPLKVRKSTLRKSLCGSPHRIGNDRHSPPYSRNRSPAGRMVHNQKNYRRYSPSQNRPYNRKPLHARRSLSPRNNGHHHALKRSKSPVNNSKRSRSKSPNRNFASRPNRGERGGMNKRRRSPLYNRKGVRNSNRSKRKSTPTQHRSPSPVNKRKVDHKSQNSHHQSTDDKKTLENVKKNKIDITEDDVATDKAAAPQPAAEKSTELTENKITPSSDDDTSSDENEEDGIDLFASEESESENEGRFKSNSSKNVRSNTAATVSFSKLGNATTSALGDLNEVKSDKNSSSSHRENRYKRGSNYSNRKDDRSKKYGSSRNDDNRYGDVRSNYETSSRHNISSSASAAPKVMIEEKKKEDKLMFKSTFQVLPNEMKSEAVKSTPKSTISSRVSPIKEKTGEKKLIVVKRPAEPITEEQVEEEIEKIPSTGENAKKSKHARLVAPTKTWKNKKSWRTEKL